MCKVKSCKVKSCRVKPVDCVCGGEARCNYNDEDQRWVECSTPEGCGRCGSAHSSHVEAIESWDSDMAKLKGEA